MKRLYPLEEDICIAFWSQVEQLKAAKRIGTYDIYCVSNNQRGNSMIRQVMDKRIGVKRGVADYCIPGIGYLEAKRIERHLKDGSPVITKQSDEQKDFQKAMQKKGLRYALFWTPQQGIEILLSWLPKKHGFIPAGEFLPHMEAVHV